MPKVCACLDDDARACYDLRVYGSTPVLRGPLHLDVIDESLWRNVNPDDDDECDCACHSDYGDDEDGPACSLCGCEMQWEDCDNCGGKGYHDGLDEIDPLFYGPDDTERCDWCQGKGGGWFCWERECRQKRGAIDSGGKEG